MPLFYPKTREAHRLPVRQGEPKCPAEENANSERSPPINVRKSYGRTDTRTNKADRLCPPTAPAGGICGIAPWFGDILIKCSIPFYPKLRVPKILNNSILRN
jgi:hypothetical protein